MENLNVLFKNILHSLYELALNKDIDIDTISYDKMRKKIQSLILKDEYNCLTYLHHDIFESIVSCYEQNDYQIHAFENFISFPFAAVILNEQHEFDATALKFINDFFNKFNIDRLKEAYRLQSIMMGLVSSFKVISFYDAMSLCFEYCNDNDEFVETYYEACFKGLTYQNRIEIIDEDTPQEMFLVDGLTPELNNIVFESPYFPEIDTDSYDADFFIHFGNKKYFNLNDEARELYNFIIQHLDSDDFIYELESDLGNFLTDEQRKVYKYNRHLAIIEQIVTLAQGYTHIEDILFRFLPDEENELSREALRIFTNFIHTIPCSYYSGTPYGKIVLDESDNGLLVSEKDNYDFSNILTPICAYIHSNCLEVDEDLVWDYEVDNTSKLDFIFHQALTYIVDNPDVIDEMLENNIYMSNERRQSYQNFKNCLVEWCMFYEIRDDYLVFVDQETNAYACKIVDPMILNYIFQTRKKNIYIPLALINYKDYLIAFNLCTDLFDYKVPNKVSTKFKTMKKNGFPLILNYQL